MALETETIVGFDQTFHPYLLPLEIHSNRIVSRVLLRTSELPDLGFLIITRVSDKAWPLSLEVDRPYLPFSEEVSTKLQNLAFLISTLDGVLRSTPKIRQGLIFDTFTRKITGDSTNKYYFGVDPDDPKLTHLIAATFSYSNLNFQK
ncbi:MAG: hypothetical protein Q8P92_03550 [Candidatus Daviesbacteria bacterium]|nr:hypothetical protein [Candidatus Daviesbacteria bacterium]